MPVTQSSSCIVPGRFPLSLELEIFLVNHETEVQFLCMCVFLLLTYAIYDETVQKKLLKMLSLSGIHVD